uniref:Uncharacterized protein n=1 Tax=Anopheles funestus TaxID=62324 RepID=A0A182S2U6_ANOFN
ILVLSHEFLTVLIKFCL